MSHVDVSILQHMRDNIKGGFDEERHGPRIGFGNLKRYVNAAMTVWASYFPARTPCIGWRAFGAVAVAVVGLMWSNSSC